MATQPEPSSLILQELFSQGDDQFLPALLQSSDARKVAPLLQRWIADPRPWARKLMIDFLGQAMVGRERALPIKRIYKNAEKSGDDEIVGACMAAFDRLVRRRVCTRWTWINRQAQSTETLRAPPVHDRTFSYATTCYLRRRAWRYFRRKGFARDGQYVKSVSAALRQYTDGDVAEGRNLLDCWGLMHACFGKSQVLTFNRRHTNITPGGGLGQLAAAPMFERHWQQPQAGAVLMELLLAAQCRSVRIWAIHLLRRHHAASLAGTTADLLLRLLASDDADVQQFGAELLSNAVGTATLPLETWLQLLTTQNFEALQVVCEAFAKHVSFDRLTLEQTVELTNSTAVPVARLGWNLLRQRKIAPAGDGGILSRLADLRCEAIGYEVAAWALQQIGAAGAYQVDLVVPFFDSLLARVRLAAIQWLTPQSAGYADAALYARLIETPYDDVRIFLVAELSQRSKLPGAGDESLASIWAAVLLNIHRGGRAKLIALRQISRAIIENPSRAGQLLPVLAVAIRSVRGTEARHGLAALVSAQEANPALADAVARQFPEMTIVPVEQEAGR